jgi:hypothetical protein
VTFVGGFYKSKRTVAKRLQVHRYQSPAGSGTFVPTVPRTADNTLAWIDSQETTSYRSRGRKGDEEIIPSNSAEFIELQNQDKENPLHRVTYDVGHPFTTIRVTRDGGFNDGGYMDLYDSGPPDRVTRVSHLHPDFFYNYNGFRNGNSDPDPDWFFGTNSDNNSGNRLLNAAAPNRPNASAATALGEILLSGLPTFNVIRALREGTEIARSAGSQYLNVQFGWLPLVSDTVKIVKALLNASKILQDFAAGSGQITRRRRSLFPQQFSQVFTGANVNGGNAAFLSSYAPDGSLIRSFSGGFTASVAAADLEVAVNAERRTSFSGAFTYYVPNFDGTLMQDLSAFEARANVLLGTRLTPEVLWELTPWSWLIDWLVGLQANISVATRFDSEGLVLRYGYLTVIDRVSVNALYAVSGNHPITPHGTYKKSAFTRMTYFRMRRIKSTPFGFGLDTATFTAPQWSILAALGMTRAPRILK